MQADAGTGLRLRLDGSQNDPERLQIAGRHHFVREGGLVRSLDQQQFGGVVRVFARCGAVRRRSDVGMENPVPGSTVSVPEHRGIDIAEEEDGDAKHRHRAPERLLVSVSAH